MTEEGGRRVNDPSRGGILVCEDCGERMVLDGPISVWLSGGISFECECGKRLAPSGRLERKGFGNTAADAASPTAPHHP
jgi:hypothetical protein